MRKVIGFKLGLRLKEIQRRAKKAKLDLDGAGFPEPDLQAFLDAVAKTLKPAVLFETFPSTDADQAALSPMPGLAYSLILATLGEGFRQPTDERGTAAQGLWPLIVDVALEDAVTFASRLLQDDAEKDACELSPISTPAETAALAAALRKLDAGKIGVSLGEDTLIPAASRVASLSWLSKSKAKGKSKP